MTQSSYPAIHVVSGATGAQGGATARALLARGHRVRALTREPASPAAVALGELGAEVLRADFDDPAGLEAALAGADGLFAMSTPFGTDLDTEVRQALALVDAAQAAGVAHVVYTSAANADRSTGIPHFETKYLVEKHLRGLAVDWTVIAPAAFLDNWTSGWSMEGLRSGVFALPMPAGRPLAVISAADIGAFAALVLERRAEFAGRRVDIASDERTPAQIGASIATAMGRELDYEEVPLEVTARYSADLAAMFAYFTETGMDVDVAALRRDYPEVGWRGVDDWAAGVDWRV
ncbi:NmrA/HSCARG family protein [Phytomonospora sp. NPDC050363]|uniref:NmrA/HSCARG family protein n=1 Tax=Phytomonospora sp. NPDC050363 TaxID=3155642 RepID=UPI0033CD187E